MVSGVRKLEIHKALETKLPKAKAMKYGPGRRAPKPSKYAYRSGHK